MSIKKTVFAYIFLFSALFLLFTTNCVNNINKSEESEKILIKAFNTSNAEVVSTEIYFWGHTENKCSSYSELKKLANICSEELGIIKNLSYSKKEYENNNDKTYEISGVTKYDNLVDINIHYKNGEHKAQYIMVSVVEDGSVSTLEMTRSTLCRIFEKNKITPETSTCITGTFNGELGYDKLNGICNDIFSEAGAHKVEGIEEGNFLSISAYSPSINNSILSNGRKINLNLALRYNSYEGKTYIWLGTPVITTGY